MLKKSPWMLADSKILPTFATVFQEDDTWRGARVVEEARLESVYTPKAYHGFESRSLRKEGVNLIITRFTPFLYPIM